MKPLKRSFIVNSKDWKGRGVLSILGSTGVGKTALALTLAKKFQALLVSVDSVAVYKGLDIGSSKPMGLERSEYNWVGLDLWSPQETYDVDAYVLAVQKPIEEALQNSRPVILVGGSHFYEQALVSGRGPGEASDAHYLLELEKQSSENLFNALLDSDPRFGVKVHPHDRYRLKRFSDLHLRQKLSFDELFLKAPQSFLSQFVSEVSCLPLGMDLDNEFYESKLKKRINEMFQLGFWREVEKLLEQGIPSDSPALQSVGYSQVVEAIKLGQKNPNDELSEKILIAHRQLGKRQRTWIRGLVKKSFLLPQSQ